MLKNLECDQLKQMKMPPKNIIIHLTLSALFRHHITKDLLLTHLFSQSLTIGIYKTLMQSLYLCMATDFHAGLLPWLDCLSEAYFIKSQFSKVKEDPEVVAVLAKI